MPWVKRSGRSYKLYWIAAGIASVVVGVFIGYEWGNTTSVVTVVERHLTAAEARVRKLEKQVKALETKLGVDASESDAEPTAKLY